MGHSTGSGRNATGGAAGQTAQERAESRESARVVTAEEQNAWNRMLDRGDPDQLRTMRRSIRRAGWASSQPGEGTMEIRGVGKVTYNREPDGSFTIRTTLAGMKRPKKKTIQAGREIDVRGEARNTLEKEWIMRNGRAR